jgi:cytochrome o ubiquinol oxidase operon protein cyoD
MPAASDQGRERRDYILGYVLALIFSLAAFAATAWPGLSRPDRLWIIAGCALPQALVHFRFFLHIDLARSHRHDLQLILFSTLIVMLMVGGTLWILSNQHARMG